MPQAEVYILRSRDVVALIMYMQRRISGAALDKTYGYSEELPNMQKMQKIQSIPLPSLAGAMIYTKKYRVNRLSDVDGSAAQFEPDFLSSPSFLLSAGDSDSFLLGSSLGFSVSAGFL